MCPTAKKSRLGITDQKAFSSPEPPAGIKALPPPHLTPSPQITQHWIEVSLGLNIISAPDKASKRQSFIILLVSLCHNLTPCVSFSHALDRHLTVKKQSRIRFGFVQMLKWHWQGLYQECPTEPPSVHQKNFCRNPVLFPPGWWKDTVALHCPQGYWTRIFQGILSHFWQVIFKRDLSILQRSYRKRVFLT